MTRSIYMFAHTVEMSAIPQFVWRHIPGTGGIWLHITCVGTGCVVF